MANNVFIANPKSREEIYRTAQIVRNLSKQMSPYFDIVRFVENELCIWDADFAFQILEDRELGIKHAEAIPDEHTILVAHSVYLGAIAGNGRDRGTLAHEVGHYILHDGSTVHLARTMADTVVPPYQDPEWQAKVFQGELLAPHSMIYGMDVTTVVRKFGVSRQSAEIQLMHAKKSPGWHPNS